VDKEEDTMAGGEPQPQRMQVNVELPRDLEAIYANFALITHSPSEIVIDLARILPNVPKAKVYARVVMTPMNAKLLLRALEENLSKFEAQFGEIKTPERGFGEDRPIGFKH
jgi:hypothetical protein